MNDGKKGGKEGKIDKQTEIQKVRMWQKKQRGPKSFLRDYVETIFYF